MKYLTLAFITTFFAQGALAETVNYSCTMTKRDSHGWIAKEYAFRVDAENKAALVADNPEWLATRFKDRGAKGYRLSWNRTMTASAGGNLRVRYQANLNPTKKSVTVRMAFVSTNASNKPYGTGTCLIQK
ncbi:hypothetical protein [uncultured Ruegeria sp.]|uniref:hypothetical protein n=1 Tax=uncultured Ruegeria sp. TaxID=259304 RepID=UPI00262C9F94|nr:hypothetical protein [uncultured Ruegeria sp.]